jgi:hypothetical protein
VLQVLPGAAALIAEHRDIPKPPVLLQFRHPPGIGSQNLGNVFVALPGQRQVVVGMLDHDLVSAQAAHLVIDAFRAAIDFTLDVVERSQVGNHPHLPVRLAVRMLIDGARTEVLLPGAKGAPSRLLPIPINFFLDHPALSNGIFAKFH